MNLRLIIYINSLIAVALGMLMALPAIIDWQSTSTNHPHAFSSATLLILMIGGAVMLMSRRRGSAELSSRGALMLTVSLWLLLSLFAAIPFYLSGFSPMDSFFESVSGLTTTGSTIMTGLDQQPKSLLLWRALLQWIGGIGIIVTAIAILPMLKVGGMQLFQLESSDRSEKVMNRTQQIAWAVAALYLVLTVACLVAYRLTGMSFFDSLCHAMTTIATGGFSTSDLSIGKFADGGADLVAIFFMIAGSLPFALYILMLRGNWRALFKDEQVRVFFYVLFSFCIIIFFAVAASGLTTNQAPWRASLFNVTSIMTGTGYATESYDHWGGFVLSCFLILTFIGGCAGSTTCGIKIFRHVIAAKSIWVYTKSMIRPHAINGLRYNGRIVDRAALDSILGFYFLFILLVIGLAVTLNIMGLDFLTAISASATSFSNVGPGLGQLIGPSGTFSQLSDPVKLLLCGAMLVGRLEVFTVIAILTPEFWRGR